MLQNIQNFLTERSQKWLFYLLFVLSTSFLTAGCMAGISGCVAGISGCMAGIFCNSCKAGAQHPWKSLLFSQLWLGSEKSLRSCWEGGRHRDKTVHEAKELCFHWEPSPDLTIPWMFAVPFITRVSISAYFWSLSLKSPRKFGNLDSPSLPSPPCGSVPSPWWCRREQGCESSVPSPLHEFPPQAVSAPPLHLQGPNTRVFYKIYISLWQHKHFSGRWIVHIPVENSCYLPGYPEAELNKNWDWNPRNPGHFCAFPAQAEQNKPST